MRILHQHFHVQYRFPIIFTRDAFSAFNPSLNIVLRESGQRKNRILIIVDSNLLGASHDLLKKIDAYTKIRRDMIELVSPPLVVKGGERCKNDPAEIRKIHAYIGKFQLCRRSFILVIGGAAVLDAVGFAAATAHRGIRLIRMPSTVLGQSSAGVSVKNAINAFGRKNFLGSFAPPYAVINDLNFLTTLSERDRRAGIAEAVKISLIRDDDFFHFLYEARQLLSTFAVEKTEHMIMKATQLHMEHMAKTGEETGSEHALDFGYWSAHKIVELSGGEVNHGEALAIGIALDSLYAFRKGLLNETELYRILITLEDLGFELYHPALLWIDIPKALREFQESMGGELTITLPNHIGKTKEVHAMDTELVKRCIGALGARAELKGKKRCGDASQSPPKDRGFLFY